MNKKSASLAVLLAVTMVVLSACGTKNPTSAGSTPVAGLLVAPTEIAPPLAISLPESLEEAALHPEIYDPSLNVYVQIQTIAQDSRAIPASAWTLGGQTPPDSSGAVALYVRVRAGDQVAQDPFWSDATLPSSNIKAANSDDTYFGLSGCLTQSTRGDFLPPSPGYEPLKSTLQPGEMREGWIVCPAPAINISDQRFDWVSSTGTENLWAPISRLAFGVWAVLPNATIVNRADGTTVYQGDAWMSVLGAEFVPPQAKSDILPGLPSSVDCVNAVAVNNSGRLTCESNSKGVIARMHIRISYPGMASDGVVNTDLYASQVPVTVGLTSDGSYISESVVDLPLSGWVAVNAPDSIKGVWFFVDSTNKVVWGSDSIGPVNTPSGQTCCGDGKCIGPLDQTNFTPYNDGEYEIPDAFTRETRYLCPGETAMGMTVGTPITGEPNHLELYPSLDSVDLLDSSKFGRGSDASSLYIPMINASDSLLRRAFLFIKKDGVFLEPIQLSAYGYLAGSNPPVSWEPDPNGVGLNVTENAYLYAEMVDSLDFGSMYVVLGNSNSVIWRLSCESGN
ncbi:MAG: hypothetical protein NTZ74_04555 [Chloroflexi bacterium]|nr:hypothetical protein [Chloroflexota bacterium]